MNSVLITGAGGGIGSVLCQSYVEAGYHVIGIDRREIDSPQFEFIQYDIATIHTEPTGFERFRKAVMERVGDDPLTTIVNNAAIQIVKPAEKLTWEDWQTTFDTNLFAPFFIIQAFLPELREHQGAVVNIASIHAHLTKREFAAYATSKGALLSMTRALALDLSPEVRVNAIIPAATDTPMLRAGFDGNMEAFDMLGQYHPLGRVASPTEVADVALFLSANGSSFITGSAIWVDGGIGGVLSDPIYAR